MTPRHQRLALTAILLLLGLAPESGSGAQAAPGAPSFSREILPVLSENCFSCHGPDEKRRKGNLRLDLQAEASKPAKSGLRAIVPGRPDQSELIRRITTVEPDESMPPAKTTKHLTQAQKDLFARWIAAGAPWQSHWAYAPLTQPGLPAVRNQVWPRNAIDRFVLSRLEREGLNPSPEADRITLLRRLSLDLTGLPPTPPEVETFLADRSPDAYEKAVTRLISSPHYGERMALPWLDAARYADSNGFQQDGDTHQYAWRDWVVRAMNRNLPFDQFTIEQLAGDLLPQATLEQKVATGFNRCHMLNGEGGAIPEEQRNVNVFDRVDVTATTWLGVTMACCQCHDHKYDPFSMRDYYQFFAFFNNVPENGTPSGGGQYRLDEPTIFFGNDSQIAARETLKALATNAAAELERVENGPAVQAELAGWEKTMHAATSLHPAAAGSLPTNILAHLAVGTGQRSAAATKEVRDYFLANHPPEVLKAAREKAKAARKKVETLEQQLARVMIMSDARPRQTRILERGNYEMPRDNVHPDTPGSLPPLPPDAPRNRLGLARWLVSPENPLTARVQANRQWQLFFGKGLVKTSENLGTQSESPVHPELLDWLAAELRDHGWDVKRLQRIIVTSATYRQSSRVSPSLRDRDPENQLLARGARFRLPSLLLRDVALAASGLLERPIGGKPVYPYQPRGIWDGLAITKERDFTYPESAGQDLYRRSLYTFWRRTVAPGNMFDASVRQTCKVRTSLTSTPLHALTTLNDITWVEASRALAERVMKGSRPGPRRRLQEAFRLVCARPPAPDEIRVLLRGFERALAHYRTDPDAAAELLATGESPCDPALDPLEHAAYATVCLTIFNLDEALTRE